MTSLPSPWTQLVEELSHPLRVDPGFAQMRDS